MIRRSLDAIYLASGYLAGFFLFSIAASIIAQIVGRFVGLTIDGTELSGFCLAASSFLGLAYALRHGSHIRVNLLIRGFKGRARWLIELWCSGVGAVAMGYFTYQAVSLVLESYDFGDISPGLIAAPFWIPQSGMALGLAVLTLAFIDEFVRVARGAEPAYEANIETVDDIVADHV